METFLCINNVGLYGNSLIFCKVFLMFNWEVLKRMKLWGKKFNLLIVGVALAFCFACGSSDDDNKPNVLTGQFIDAAVGGINYRTETQEGITNANGEFSYIAEETIVFSIGDINFPSATAKTVLTPCDLADTDKTSDKSLINMARLLQTLDTDGNPENGITISTDAHTAFSNLTTTIEFDSVTFDTDVVESVKICGSVNDTLVDASDAIKHLDKTISAILDNTPEIDNVNFFDFFDYAPINHGEIKVYSGTWDTGDIRIEVSHKNTNTEVIDGNYQTTYLTNNYNYQQARVDPIYIAYHYMHDGTWILKKEIDEDQSEHIINWSKSYINAQIGGITINDIASELLEASQRVFPELSISPLEYLKYKVTYEGNYNILFIVKGYGEYVLEANTEDFSRVQKYLLYSENGLVTKGTKPDWFDSIADGLSDNLFF